MGTTRTDRLDAGRVAWIHRLRVCRLPVGYCPVVGRETSAEVTRWIDARPDRVWAVLCDGWLYPAWVVGALRMREVDAGWPAPGTLLHHSVGVWPLSLDDVTESLDSRPGELLRLHAHGWPVGTAEVELRLSGSGTGTEVAISEDAVAGPTLLMPRVLRSLLIRRRNRETLRRLAYVAEGAHR